MTGAHLRRRRTDVLPTVIGIREIRNGREIRRYFDGDGFSRDRAAAVVIRRRSTLDACLPLLARFRGGVRNRFEETTRPAVLATSPHGPGDALEDVARLVLALPRAEGLAARSVRASDGAAMRLVAPVAAFLAAHGFDDPGTVDDLDWDCLRFLHGLAPDGGPLAPEERAPEDLAGLLAGRPRPHRIVLDPRGLASLQVISRGTWTVDDPGGPIPLGEADAVRLAAALGVPLVPQVRIGESADALRRLQATADLPALDREMARAEAALAEAEADLAAVDRGDANQVAVKEGMARFRRQVRGGVATRRAAAVARAADPDAPRRLGRLAVHLRGTRTLAEAVGALFPHEPPVVFPGEEETAARDLLLDPVAATGGPAGLSGGGAELLRRLSEASGLSFEATLADLSRLAVERGERRPAELPVSPEARAEIEAREPEPALVPGP